MAIREKMLGPEHFGTAVSHHDIALLREAQKRPQEAETSYRNALSILEKLYPNGHRDTALTLYRLGQFQRSLDRPADAEASFRRVLAMMETVFGPEHAQTLAAVNALAWALQEQSASPRRCRCSSAAWQCPASSTVTSTCRP